jgi:hypothetical protein
MFADSSWPDAVFARSEHVIRRDVGGETVLVPIASSGAADLEYLYRMNAVGAAVWDLLDGQRTVAEISQRVRDSFEGSPDSVEKDVRAFLADLEEAKLVNRR